MIASKISSEVYPSLQFLKSEKDWYQIFKSFLEFTMKPSIPGVFFGDFSLLMQSPYDFQSIQIFYFFMTQFWYILSVQEFVHFTQVIPFVGIQLFTVFTILFISVESIGMFPLSFLILPFFLVHLGNGYSILLTFSKHQLFFIDFLYQFLFSIWSSALISVIFALVFLFQLIKV